ncbi:hypothetical protein ATANTOWER_020774 [Ataeniobius toweri]|uniref:Uncharacterized protein n=1 Tax=Ataeniobius toweri TaxID=208326 RepID=A0ABU7AVF2_9TELE|nr:hypothetical protein [Ataeniobius toweri]
MIFMRSLKWSLNENSTWKTHHPCRIQSLVTGCSNQRQVRTPPQPIISQGITFKDPLHGKHRSSAELRPSFTMGSQLLPYQGLQHHQDRIPGGKTYLIIILRCLFKPTSSSAFTSPSGVRAPKK